MLRDRWKQAGMVLACIGALWLAVVWWSAPPSGQKSGEPVAPVADAKVGDAPPRRAPERGEARAVADDDASRLSRSGPVVEPIGNAAVSETSPPDPPPRPTLLDAPDVMIAYLRDGSHPMPARRVFIERLANQPTPAAWLALRAVADADIYLSHAAIKAMYGAKSADRDSIASYLERKLLAPDPRAARAAIDAYARTIGAEAVKPISEAIKKGRETDHAFFDQVAEAGYTALGALADPEAVPFLASESMKVGKNIAMGSTIVKALSNIVVPEARAAILRYADDLAGRMPEKPMERAHYEKHIAEARALAAGMGL